MAYTYSIDDPAKNSKRTLAFILVVIIHLLFFWVLASGLGAKMVEVVMGPVETKIIEELPDEDKEPPPPPPDIETPPPYVPPPEISSDAPSIRCSCGAASGSSICAAARGRRRRTSASSPPARPLGANRISSSSAPP